MCLRASHATLVLGLALVAAGTSSAAEDKPSPEQARFFEREVRPVLVENCFSCHGEKKQRGGLRLTTREAVLAGGDSGPAVVPGNPEESLLVEAIRHGSLKMPPKGKLSGPQVAALEQWVKMGAPWPGEPEGSAAATGPRARTRQGEFSDEDRHWWAFQPLREPSVPTTAWEGGSGNPIDAFIGRGLRDAGLSPAPEADPETLIRRLSFDLVGLPPTREAIDAFVADGRPDAYERLVDSLLGSPRYGERWARHWLDLVRYADSDGYRIDHYRPTAWLYRDYVVRAFNDDKPYDRFVQEQIAGDELFPGDGEARIATGYLRHWVYEYNNRDVRGQWSVILNDITDTTGDVFLGLGIQCARCHDHKFDPILQKDYFRLQAFFAALLPRDDQAAASADEVDRHRARLAAWEAKTTELRHELAGLEQGYREKAAHEAIRMFPEDIQAMIRKPVAERSPLEHQLAELAYRQVDYAYTQLDARLKGKDKERILALRKQLAAFDREKPTPLAAPLSATDVGPEAPPTVVPKKGNDPVAPGFLTILEPGPATVSPPDDAPQSTGRRAALARWLTRPDNPLSTRVIVNRVWQYHFGRGLAANSSDFGHLGERPSHPELLDWLTARFVREGWSLKPLHRLIVTSATYRQSTQHPQVEVCRLKDPENRLYWRGNTRRLDAEQIRDSVFAVTGELSEAAGGPAVESAQPRRTIYTRVLRNNRDPLLDVFDLPIFFSSAPSRDTTTTPLQSLYLINNQTMLLRARALAMRLEREAPDAENQVEAAYRLAFGRRPRTEERAAALRFLAEQARRIDPAEAASADAEFLKGKLPRRDGQAAILEPGGPQRRFDIRHGASLETGPFTVEAFFQLRSVYDTGAVRTVVAKWDGDLKSPGWAFGVTGKGSRRKPQTLVLQLLGTKQGAGFGEEAVFSDQQIQLDRPYYAAASVRLAGDGPGEVTFYLKDLADDDQPLFVARVPHAVSGGFGNTLPLTIGGRGGKAESGFDGVIDDVRLSSRPLEAAELLYHTEARNPHTVGYWRFETEPGVFRDSSGHGLDLHPAARKVEQVDPRRAALVDFCHVLFNSSEFLYVD